MKEELDIGFFESDENRCPYCGQVFADEEAYIKHITNPICRTRHEKPIIERKVMVIREIGKPYCVEEQPYNSSCRNCGESLTNATLYQDFWYGDLRCSKSSSVIYCKECAKKTSLKNVVVSRTTWKWVDQEERMKVLSKLRRRS